MFIALPSSRPWPAAGRGDGWPQMTAIDPSSGTWVARSAATTQRYLHPDAASIAAAGDALTAFLNARRSPNGPQLRMVPNPARSTPNTKEAR
jgi:hypothetical protein